MPGGRRNAKNSSFKHHGHSSDDRHGCDLPTQPQVIPPKHIPVPELPGSSDLYLEMDAFVLSIFAMAGQYINLYKSVFWLPYSHTEYALNYYLIDYYVLTINLIMVGKRLPACLLKQLCNMCFPAAYQATCVFCIHISMATILTPVLLYCLYYSLIEHGILGVFFLIYPIVIHVIVMGGSLSKFFELQQSSPPERSSASVRGKGTRVSAPVSHTCSMSAETIREEVETLRGDFNVRWKQVLFNCFIVLYYATFLPCYFSQSALHYDLNWVAQHAVFSSVGCLTLYIAYCFPPKYCDVLHRAALHLGRWQKVEIKNVHVPYSTWTETSMWNQGALVKHLKELYKAEGISNAAEPGNWGHYRFYTLFKNPSNAAMLVWLLQLLLIASEMLILLQAHAWNDLISLQLLILMNCRTLYGMTRVHFVVKKIYHEEKLLMAKFTN